MPVEWSSSPPELLLRLDRSARGPLRDQLQEALRDAIRTGRLARGERLPASRALARQGGAAGGAGTECSAQLAAEGYLRAQRGAATWVADTGVVATPDPLLSDPALPPLSADFRPGVPDLGAFPRADWARA